ncbi:hypothetical protein DMB95_00910 [Campylobacter sp. MIT 12-8780]|uniref:hypothetical protein n=1 Tax=unclassified Campylobacter TaxID=2593542 RepID=UPI0010F9B76C|nr:MULTISPECIES: hypothetical protein [unclassified Campylobacter]TKX29290.1 hypothetical protein CQA38_04205 [Campylobacter sp. MIT 12-5580]TQR43092.1 hypothetical protein DMB95_00910 [Campylobacter sp. MIT 12-8780]
MKNDKSLEEINLVKLVIYAMIFVLICGLLVLILILPMVKNYKNVSLRLYSQNSVNAHLNEKFQVSESKLNTLRSENEKIFTQFDSSFDEEDFIKFLNTYFTNVKLKKLENTNTNQYLFAEFNISATLKSTAEFYEFIDALNAYKNIIKLETPVDFKAQGDIVDINFITQIYTSASTQK